MVNEYISAGVGVEPHLYTTRVERHKLLETEMFERLSAWCLEYFYRAAWIGSADQLRERRLSVRLSNA